MKKTTGQLKQKLTDSLIVDKLAELANSHKQQLIMAWLFIMSVLLFFCLLSYNPSDAAWSHLASTSTPPTNMLGYFGATLADLLYTFLGYLAWLSLVWLGLEIYFATTRARHVLPLRLFAYTFLQACLSVLGYAVGQWLGTHGTAIAGIIGYECYHSLNGLLGHIATLIFAGVFSALIGYLLLSPNKPKAKVNKSAPSSHKTSPISQQERSAVQAVSQQPPSTTSPSTSRPTGVLSSFLLDSGLSDEVDDLPTLIAPATASTTTASTGTTTSSAKPPSTSVAESIATATDSTAITPPTQDSPPSTSATASATKSAINTSTATDNTSSVASGTTNTPVRTITTQATAVTAPVSDTAVLETPPIFAGLQLDSSNSQPTNTPTPNSSEPTLDNPVTQDSIINVPTQQATNTPRTVTLPIATPNNTSDNEPTTVSHTAQASTDNTPSHTATQTDNDLPPTNDNAKPDIHDDDSYRTRSFAMATAKHRASLSALPSVDLLDPKVVQSFGYTNEQLTELADKLEIKLQEFNIKGEVKHITQGPIVTNFEVELAAGVRASRVTTITSDLARSLAVDTLRVVEVISGKPYIGIEIPNKSKETVKLTELLESPDYTSDKLGIAMAIGKDITGKPIIADLAKAPHMLVAGTTGSGKSVFVNSLILSILLKYTPDELRLVMIDPKVVEFTLYADIPHLITPVITDVEADVMPALSWCVAEMERRYQLMGAFKVRKLDELNKKISDSVANGTPLLDPLWQPNDSVSSVPPKLKPLPLIVMIADEYNDLVKQVGKPLEDAVVRIAQKARAAGMHMIIATQRPSVDVITGLIKSNIPSRVAMMLKTKVDSRTVIDMGGAETLLGDGDMLFIAPGRNDIMRAHGAYITEQEIMRITEAWRERGTPDYVDLVSEAGDYIASSDDTSDPLYQDAVSFMVDSGKTSISALQRHLSIGYNRAAKIVEDMEARGILSPPDASGKRSLIL